MDSFLTVNLFLIALLPSFKFNTSLNYVDSFFYLAKNSLKMGLDIYPKFFHVENMNNTFSLDLIFSSQFFSFSIL